jgi:hypothetical protein
MSSPLLKLTPKVRHSHRGVAITASLHTKVFYLVEIKHPNKTGFEPPHHTMSFRNITRPGPNIFIYHLEVKSPFIEIKKFENEFGHLTTHFQ